MAKTAKKVSIRALDEIMKNNYKNETVVSFYDNDVVIKKMIPVADVISFVENITESCFMSDGDYRPEVFDIAFKIHLVNYYSNITMPDNTEHAYSLICALGLEDMVYENVNKAQVEEIKAAALRKIKYICDKNNSEAKAEVDRLIYTFATIQDQLEDVFSGVSQEDIAAMSKALGSGMIDEGKIVDAYVAKTGDE